MAMWKNVACVVKKMRKDAPANRKDEFDCIFTFKKKHYAQYSLRKKTIIGFFRNEYVCILLLLFHYVSPPIKSGRAVLDT